ncbi:MAG: NUDIX hydrolase [Chloroflexota bacterium]|nr:NUDIX hydrolase [Chloroflexota bacterium]
MPGHARRPLWPDKTPAQKLATLRDQMLDLYRYQLGDALAEISAMLDAHQPADAKEARDIQRIKDLIEAHPNILNRNCEVGHITASAAIVDLAARRALLHWHKRLNRWLQVGGHTDYETDIAQAALREAREETGLPDLAFYPPRGKPAPIDYDVHSIPETGDAPAHLHLDFRYLLVTERPAALAPAKGESTRFRWLTFAEALRPGDAIDESLRRLLRKAAALIDIEIDQESA